MLSRMGTLWFSTVTFGVIGHRLYFRPSHLSTATNFRQARHGQSTCQRSCFSTSCEVKQTCCRAYLFWHCKWSWTCWRTSRGSYRKIANFDSIHGDCMTVNVGSRDQPSAKTPIVTFFQNGKQFRAALHEKEISVLLNPDLSTLVNCEGTLRCPVSAV